MKRTIGLILAAVLLGFEAAHADEPLQEPVNASPGPEHHTTVPKLKHKVEPHYTQVAIDAGIQGTVLLALVIDERGLPRDIVVLSPLGFGLDERAVATVSQWKFKPATRDGTPVKSPAHVEVHFRLIGKNFDSKAEERRTTYNSIVSHLAQQKDDKPSEQDVKKMQDLAKHNFPAADYLMGMWELRGEALPKDVPAGLASIQKAADKNYGPALFFIGQAQMQGNLLPKNPANGLSLIRDAAVLGSEQAQFLLGEMYDKGDGVAADLDRAKRYFRLCAASGAPECEFRLGRLLLASPQDGEQDRVQAIAWLQLAGSHNLTAAGAIASAEAAKLTPEQMQQVMKLRSQLERKP